MKYVFISYSSKDSGLAEKICCHLEKNEVRCWMAPRDIAAGMDYTAAIPGAIAHCSCFLLALTHNTQSSPWVHNELIDAVSKGKTIIPFLAEKFRMAENFEFLLRGSHWEDGSENWDAALDRVVASVKSEIPPKQEQGITTTAERDAQHALMTSTEADVTSDVLYFRNIIRKAIDNDHEAQITLAQHYYDGHGISRDYEKAVYWISQACKHKDSKAMYLLGKCYEQGRGVKRNMGYAALYYEDSASQPVPYSDAIYKIVECYTRGKGVSHDPLKVAFWTRKAMQLENIDEAQQFSQVQYTYNYLELLKKSSPEMLDQLKNAGYSTQDVSQEHVLRVEKLYREKKRQDTFITLACLGELIVIPLIIYLFALGLLEIDLLCMPHSIIIACWFLITAGLFMPVVVDQLPKRNTFLRVILSILIFLALLIVAAIGTIVIYWLAQLLKHIFIYVATVTLVFGIFLAIINKLN